MHKNTNRCQQAELELSGGGRELCPIDELGVGNSDSEGECSVALEFLKA